MLLRATNGEIVKFGVGCRLQIVSDYVPGNPDHGHRLAMIGPAGSFCLTARETKEQIEALLGELWSMLTLGRLSCDLAAALRHTQPVLPAETTQTIGEYSPEV